jgi:hypothetical protein
MACCQPCGRDRYGHDRSLPKIRVSRLHRTGCDANRRLSRPNQIHPEKEDTNDPPRPANVDPVKPSLPDQEEEDEEE